MSTKSRDLPGSALSDSRGEWKEVVRLTFKGESYTDHALDLDALTRLSRFQKLVSETAKELWRAANPDRERLPARFEQRTRLCLRRIEEGSSVAPLEVYLLPDPQTTFLDTAGDVSEALALVTDVFESVEEGRSLPEHLPKSLLPNFLEFGRGLEGDEEGGVSIAIPGKKPTTVNKVAVQRLYEYSEKPYEGPIDIVGEMLAADVRNRVFKIWTDDTTSISVDFSPDQEGAVTGILREHRTQRVRIRGTGQFDSAGKLVKALAIDLWEAVGPEQLTLDSTARSIEDVISELAAEVPQEEWDRLPNDLSQNLDHYLYGTPKR
jgi:hypothetical protein